jgi:putative radical SAM enzyme (TIGR03279 family)
MSVRIKSVAEDSPAQKAGVRAGDTLVSVAGHKIADVLDYMFYADEGKARYNLIRGGKRFALDITRRGDENTGLEFDSYLMSDKQSCGNNCIFCFIDQNPAGMRETIYFKDDDARLSFLQGNYVTLTGLGGGDIRRIIKMRLSLNVSVHTTNSALRGRMMNNPAAGRKLAYLKRLSDAGIKMNCQVVLCKGLNDGAELVRTLGDLGELYPSVMSVAVVPAGLTKHRVGLYHLEPFDEEGARGVLDAVNGFQEKYLTRFGTRLCFCADEFYLAAGVPLPPGEYYEDYPQFENGVGMLRSFIDEFLTALGDLDRVDETPRNVAIATGTAASAPLGELVKAARDKWGHISCEIFEVKNNFFGASVTTAGLLTAQDIIGRLEGEDIAGELLLCETMLSKDGGLFLDGYTVEDLSERLGVKIRVVKNDGGDFLKGVLGL